MISITLRCTGLGWVGGVEACGACADGWEVVVDVPVDEVDVGAVGICDAGACAVGVAAG